MLCHSQLPTKSHKSTTLLGHLHSLARCSERTVSFDTVPQCLVWIYAHFFCQCQTVRFCFKNLDSQINLWLTLWIQKPVQKDDAIMSDTCQWRCSTRIMNKTLPSGKQQAYLIYPLKIVIFHHFQSLLFCHMRASGSQTWGLSNLSSAKRKSPQQTNCTWVPQAGVNQKKQCNKFPDFQTANPNRRISICWVSETAFSSRQRSTIESLLIGQQLWFMFMPSFLLPGTLVDSPHVLSDRSIPGHHTAQAWMALDGLQLLPARHSWVRSGRVNEFISNNIRNNY